MIRKLTCNLHLRSVAALCIAILTLLIATAMLAQVAGTDPMDSNTALFLPSINFDSRGHWPESVVSGDLNGDGKPDLVVANMCDNNTGGACGYGTRPGVIAVLLGNGDGTFQSAGTYRSGGTGASSVAIADLNGDGKLDLVVANDLTPSTPCVGPCSTVGVLLGRGDGTFQPVVIYNSGTESPYKVVIADLNGDGKADLVVSGANAGVVSVLLGRGDGTFRSAVTYGSGGWGAATVAVADMNRDSKPDIVVANALSSVGILLGNGDGTFQPPVTYDSGGGQPMSVDVADLNGDDKPDVVVTNYQAANVSVLLGNGDGTLQAAVTYSSGGYLPFKVALADVNGDGRPDVLVANLNYDIGVLLGNVDGSFQYPVTYRSGGLFTSSVGIADVNGDGVPDLLVTDLEGGPKGNGLVGVLLNTSGPRIPTSTALVSNSNPAALNETVTYTATIASQANGEVDGTVIFRDGVSPIAKVTLAGNRAQYSTSYSLARSHKISAIYTGTTDSAGSASPQLTEQVRKLPFPTKMAVSTSGSPSFIGQTVTFTAMVTCGTHTIPDGELVTFYDGTTALGSVALASGMAAYATSSLSAKTHYIKATYGGDTTFLPSAGRVTQAVIKYPTTTALISIPNPSVYGQPVTFTATVTPNGPYPLAGKVWFKDGATGIGTVTLNSGVATLNKKWLSVGTHSITAQYLGDAASGKSTSSVLSQVVNP